MAAIPLQQDFVRQAARAASKVIAIGSVNKLQSTPATDPLLDKDKADVLDTEDRMDF